MQASIAMFQRWSPRSADYWVAGLNCHFRDENLVVKGASKGIVFCAAARSTIIIGMPAVRTATGTTQTTSTTISVFVFVFPTSLFSGQVVNLRYARNAIRLRLYRRGFKDGWMMSWLTLIRKVGQIWNRSAAWACPEQSEGTPRGRSI